MQKLTSSYHFFSKIWCGVRKSPVTFCGSSRHIWKKTTYVKTIKIQVTSPTRDVFVYINGLDINYLA